MTRPARIGRPPRGRALRPALVPALWLAGLLAAGCAADEQVYGGFRVGSPEALAPAEQDGRYQVKWAASAGGRLTAVPGVRRYVAGGTPIGFATDPATGGVVAVAGAERIPLDPLPPAARHLVWAMPLRSAPHRAAQAVFVAPLAAIAGWWGRGGGGGDSDDGEWNSSSGDGGYHDSSHTTSSYHDRDGQDGGGGGGPAQRESDRGYVPWASEPKVGR